MILQLTQQLTSQTTIGLTFGEILALIITVSSIIGIFWKLKIELREIKLNTDLQVAKLEKDIASIKSDAVTCRNTHDAQGIVSEKHFQDWIQNNNAQHAEMFDRINGIYTLLLERK